MDGTTLRPTPSYNPNIPIVTAAGGTNIAYKDPNSPESILKKTTELNAQAIVDTKYDANVDPYVKEGFTRRCPYGCPYACPYGCPRHCRCPYCNEGYANPYSNLQVLLFITIVVFILLVSVPSLRLSGKIFLVTICVGLLVLSLKLYHQH
jgi:hypothetical protein